MRLKKFLILTLLSVLLFSSTIKAADDDEFENEGLVEENDERVFDTDETDQEEEGPKEAYVAPPFQKPTINEKDTYFLDWFEDTKAIGKKWFKSTAKKDDVDQAIAKFNGEWAIESPSHIVIDGDYGLVVKTKARHHAIAANLNKPFKFDGKPLVVQYEVKYEEGQECGGGYLKLLTVDPERKKISEFSDKTPYTIMFGPDKCGMTSKVHLIFKHKNPKNGTISEHHAKQPSRPVSGYFEDKKTHLYTLIVHPDDRFQVLVDNVEIISGSLLTDLDPPITPPKEIVDPEDKKPDDWDDREMIEDVEATKPEDWDESQPKEIVDEEAQKPDDWLEEEEALIPDPNAKKPEDWDDEMDGEWEANKISNPKCEGVSGCGKWKRPVKQNPLYKGKWIRPKIKNPAYKGKWSARLIENPHYFEPEPYKQLAHFDAIGFELWTMSPQIVFDNILITDDITVSRKFASETFNIKVDQEAKYSTATNPSKGFFNDLIAAAEEKPWLWIVYVFSVLIPLIIIGVIFFGKKSTAKHHPKKTDTETQDDEEVEEIEEIDHEEQPEPSQEPSRSVTESPEKTPPRRSSRSSESRSRSDSRGRAQKPAVTQDDLEDDEAEPEVDETSEKSPKSRPRRRRAD
uniref:Calnexin n=1 Tax=Acrobeloides nanus TaxID=290746 RepID=A0A914E3A6_9BILA